MIVPTAAIALLLLATFSGAHQAKGNTAFLELLGANSRDLVDQRLGVIAAVETLPMVEISDNLRLVSDAPGQLTELERAKKAQGFVKDIVRLYPQIRFDDGASLCSQKKDRRLREMLAPIFAFVVDHPQYSWVFEPMGEPHKVMDAISELLRNCPGR